MTKKAEGTPRQEDSGEATKPASTILRQEIAVGNEQLDRPTRGLLLSAVSAGLEIGFGPFMVATVIALTTENTLTARLAGAVAYAIGFIIVILGRSELFTEHTSLAILPLLSGKTTLRKVARLWGLVYLGNIIGAFGVATLASHLGLSLGLFGKADVQHMVGPTLGVSATTMFFSALAAGWMMGLVSWLVTAARDTVGQLLIILLVTGSIYMLRLHHSIAGSVEVLISVFVAGTPWSEYLRFLAITTLGNAVGGIVMVGALKYGHISSSIPDTPSGGSRS